MALDLRTGSRAHRHNARDDNTTGTPGIPREAIVQSAWTCVSTTELFGRPYVISYAILQFRKLCKKTSVLSHMNIPSEFSYTQKDIVKRFVPEFLVCVLVCR